jgi:hypothetical protein
MPPVRSSHPSTFRALWDPGIGSEADTEPRLVEEEEDESEADTEPMPGQEHWAGAREAGGRGARGEGVTAHE